jgi:hypothetical protein
MGQGVRYKNKKELPRGVMTIGTTRFPGSVQGFASSQGNWPIHEHPPLLHFNLRDESLFGRKGTGTTTGMPQVVLNYLSVGRGPWRLKPFIDAKRP